MLHKDILYVLLSLIKMIYLKNWRQRQNVVQNKFKRPGWQIISDYLFCCNFLFCWYNISLYLFFTMCICVLWVIILSCNSFALNDYIYFHRTHLRTCRQFLVFIYYWCILMNNTLFQTWQTVLVFTKESVLDSMIMFSMGVPFYSLIQMSNVQLYSLHNWNY